MFRPSELRPRNLFCPYGSPPQVMSRSPSSGGYVQTPRVMPQMAQNSSYGPPPQVEPQMLQDGCHVPPPNTAPQMAQNGSHISRVVTPPHSARVGAAAGGGYAGAAPAESAATGCCSQAKGCIFAVGNQSWFTITELLRAFHRAVPMRHLLIYVPTATGPFGLQAADHRRLAEERRQALGYQVVTVLDFQFCDVMQARSLIEAAGSEACIYIEGGNTFALRHFARPFDEMCVRAVRCQGVSYVGVSAGSLLCSSTVQPALWKGLDDPHPPSMPKLDWLNPTMAKGWDLVDGLALFMHFGEEWRATVNREQVKWNYRHPLKTIDDFTVAIFTAGSKYAKEVVTANSLTPWPWSPWGGA
eukprot:gnl/TRDRNA2_/TRDRNA2_175131_c0_seq4.p1 gnl/TRDRNA2_/TRDRNA2_175131_c0~~gnl/TRDRNA2_/TRDRNA2_175131_c0_seq4.p1  ORF type:complete len:357 (-),score=58.52 gnl/TRDRNA2_/TRDRNA2_175131_c0_seq4:283-1353(-)